MPAWKYILVGIGAPDNLDTGRYAVTRPPGRHRQHGTAAQGIERRGHKPTCQLG